MILEGHLKTVRKNFFLCLLQFEKNENTELQIQVFTTPIWFYY